MNIAIGNAHLKRWALFFCKKTKGSLYVRENHLGDPQHPRSSADRAVQRASPIESDFQVYFNHDFYAASVINTAMAIIVFAIMDHKIFISVSKYSKYISNVCCKE